MWLTSKACAPNHTNTFINDIEGVGYDIVFFALYREGEEGYRDICGRTELPPCGEPRCT